MIRTGQVFPAYRRPDIRSISRHEILGVEKAEMVGSWDTFYRRVKRINIYDFEDLYDLVFG